ncbi:unnamed protein product, partial [Aphanomyces euteiches]
MVGGGVLFVLNLATTPFMAYMAEPLPAMIKQITVPDWHSYQEYTQIMTAVFQTIFHNKINSTSTVALVQDATSNTFALRYTLDLPYSIPDDQIQDYLLRLPGASEPHSATYSSISYAAHLQSYATTFLTSNVERRATMQPWQICQHEYMAGIKYGEICFWIDEVEPDPTSPRYYAWAAIYWFETPPLSWFKLSFDLSSRLMSCPEYIRYQIMLGDPGYVVLTDPFVSLAMFVDIWCGPPYVIMAVMRVSQFHDFWAYALGCIIFLEQFGLHIFASFAPVDPDFLAISAYVYGGPLASCVAMTPVAWIFGHLWDLCLPQAQKNEAIEGIV